MDYQMLYSEALFAHCLYTFRAGRCVLFPSLRGETALHTCNFPL